MADDLIDIVIVSYRCRELLRACLGSIRLNAPRAQVFVVDNDSRDGTVELVRAEFPEVDLTPSSSNLGFGRASNIGIRRGARPYVLCLNPDTALQEGSLQRLVELMAERPDVGISGCRLEQVDGSLDHAAKRSFPTLLGALGHFTGIGRGERASARLAQYRAPTVEAGPVDAVNGAFMLMRRSVLDEIGLFDEGYWMYGEDLDLCYRAKQAGWTTWYEPSVTVMHVKAGTSGRNRSLRLNYAFHYGMFRFYRTHYAPRSNAAVNAAVYAGIVLKLASAIVLSAYRRARLRLAGRGPRSVDAAPEDDRRDAADDDLQVEEQRPVVHVVRVEDHRLP
jgi:N-acetylglucosaminyl-diphospho-decaprenol L-rhamnosyltransferase